MMKFFFILLTHVLDAVIGGAVLLCLWNWFLPNHFPGIPPIAFGNAVGLRFVMAILMPHATNSSSEKSKDSVAEFTEIVVQSLLKSLIVYPLVLTLGFVWHILLG